MSEWATLRWCREFDYDRVHPEDVALLDPVVQTLVGAVLDETDGWVTFAPGPANVRVRRALLTACPAPAFRPGERVQSVPPRTAHAGHVRAVHWHFVRGAPYYLLTASASRYWSHELTRVAGPAS